jgi:putative phosphoribosyl transferase
MIFHDRTDAGRALGEAVARRYRDRSDLRIFGLPRGGVPVAFEVARSLDALLDVFVVRKLGAPGHDELAMGAIASGGVVVLNEQLVRALGVTPDLIDAVVKRETRELERREQAYRGGQPPADIEDRTVILVDDGLATGATMWAAVSAVRRRKPAHIVVAVPVGAPETVEDLARAADDVVCVATPEPFYAVAQWYRDFSQTSDDEVRDLLERARRGRRPRAA